MPARPPRALRAFWIELVWCVVSVGLFGAFVWALGWGYPLGHETIWSIGGVAVLLVAAMGARALVRAWLAGAPA